MPLEINHNYDALKANLAGSSRLKETFLIFYSSIVDGKLWCPDCRDVEQSVKDIFEGNDDINGVIVYVGDRTTWRDPANRFRQEWKISSVPTLIRLTAHGTEESRLVESEVKDRTKLEKFVAGSN
ncbi:hypothetical protein FRC02_002939 [Tulasnella sp. 418]|nr:hypothetical protein FRC02_002939 [Tulasnella sp. 418]